MNTKTLRKMLAEGYITKEDVIEGRDIKPQFDLFVKGVKLIAGVDKTPISQRDAYVRVLAKEPNNNTVKTQIMKLEQIIRAGGYSLEQLALFEDTPKCKKPKTQKEAILGVLKEEGSITSWEAFKEFGITRLASIIHILREEGLDIVTNNITKVNRYGNLVNFAKYSINNKGKI